VNNQQGFAIIRKHRIVGSNVDKTDYPSCDEYLTIIDGLNASQKRYCNYIIALQLCEGAIHWPLTLKAVGKPGPRTIRRLAMTQRSASALNE
jgi:hypothetical protein